MSGHRRSTLHAPGSTPQARVGPCARARLSLQRPLCACGRDRLIDAPFLGVTAPTPVGPARLALRTGAAVVVGVPAPAADGTLELAITRVTTADLGDASAADRERILTTRINEALSARIRDLPDGWVWMHRRWPASATTL